MSISLEGIAGPLLRYLPAALINVMKYKYDFRVSLGQAGGNWDGSAAFRLYRSGSSDPVTTTGGLSFGPPNPFDIFTAIAQQNVNQRDVEIAFSALIGMLGTMLQMGFGVEHYAQYLMSFGYTQDQADEIARTINVPRGLNSQSALIERALMNTGMDAQKLLSATQQAIPQWNDLNFFTELVSLGKAALNAQNSAAVVRALASNAFGDTESGDVHAPDELHPLHSVQKRQMVDGVTRYVASKAYEQGDLTEREYIDIINTTNAYPDPVYVMGDLYDPETGGFFGNIMKKVGSIGKAVVSGAGALIGIPPAVTNAALSGASSLAKGLVGASSAKPKTPAPSAPKSEAKVVTVATDSSGVKPTSSITVKKDGSLVAEGATIDDIAPMSLNQSHERGDLSVKSDWSAFPLAKQLALLGDPENGDLIEQGGLSLGSIAKGLGTAFGKIASTDWLTKAENVGNAASLLKAAREGSNPSQADKVAVASKLIGQPQPVSLSDRPRPAAPNSFTVGPNGDVITIPVSESSVVGTKRTVITIPRN